MYLTIFKMVSFKPKITSFNFSLFLLFLKARPKIIETKITNHVQDYIQKLEEGDIDNLGVSDSIFSNLDKSKLKSLTVSKLAVLSNKDKLLSTMLSSFKRLTIFGEFFSTKLKFLVTKMPIKAAIKLIMINVITIRLIILPNLLGLSILIMDDVIVKKIKGTITTNNKLIKISPNGLRTVALLPITKPIMAPIMIDIKRINVLL